MGGFFQPGRSLGLFAWLFLGMITCSFANENVETETTFMIYQDYVFVDQSHDNKELIIDGATVVMDGSHSFTSVHLLNGAVLTHTASTETVEYGLDLTIAMDLLIDPLSRIDVTGKGYPAGYTWSENGPLLYSASMGTGASHSGYGYKPYEQALINEIYGSVQEPYTLGAGAVDGGAGGGRVKIIADIINLDGEIRADGVASATGGGGAGGSIWVTANSFSFYSGTLTANGGDADGLHNGGGGAGRVAIHAEREYISGQEDTSTIEVNGGHNPVTNTYGGCGYYYEKSPVNSDAMFMVNSPHGGTAYLPAGIYENTGVQVDGATLVLNGSYQFDFMGLDNGAKLTHPAATATEETGIDLTLNWDFSLSADSAIDVSGKGYPAGYTWSESGPMYYDATPGTGASHSSYGVQIDALSKPNAIYGTFLEPHTLGAGAVEGGAGGGRVKITAEHINIDGNILAEGEAATEGGGGAGGSIWLTANSMTQNSGKLSVNGGDALGLSNGAGSAGYISIYYQERESNNMGSGDSMIESFGGFNSNTNEAGGVGLQYEKSLNSSGAMFMVNSPHGGTAYLPAGIYENTGIQVNGATLVLNGSYQFDFMGLDNGAKLTHPAATATEETGIDLTLNWDFFLSADSAIDVSGKGYPAGYTWSESGPMYYDATPGTGASHSSYGVQIDALSKPNAIYGTFLEPHTLGAGAVEGGAGGGRVKITAEHINIDGNILAEGEAATEGGGGAGGSIWLTANSMTQNSGKLSVNGGDALGLSNGAGSAGYISIYYQEREFNNWGDGNPVVESFGGFNSNTNEAGGVGLQYEKSLNSSGAMFMVNSPHGGTAYLPSGIYENTGIQVNGATLVLNGSYQFDFMGLDNGAKLTHPAATATEETGIDLTLNWDFSLSADSAIDVSGKGYPAGYTWSESGPMYYDAMPGTGASHSSYGVQIDALSKPNTIYGSFLEPHTLGAGAVEGGAGGGRVKITAEYITLRGNILAEGEAATEGGGGAGGSIWLTANSMTQNSGKLSVNGGDALGLSNGAGSAGYISIYYQEREFNNWGEGNPVVESFGGFNSNTNEAGGVGLQYEKSLNSSGAMFMVNSPHGGTAYLPSGIYENTGIQVNGATLVLNGSYQFDFMGLDNGAKLTHPAATATEETGIDLTLNWDFSLSADSAIDVCGKGYPAGYTWSEFGPEFISIDTRAGGSHGGLGGSGYYVEGTIPTFGLAYAPYTLGGGSWHNGSGGGRVKISSEYLSIQGEIRADGQRGVELDSHTAGGAGGSIWLDANEINFDGVISANGASAEPMVGCGGGGRVAIYYTTLRSFAGSLSVAGGVHDGEFNGEEGTIYFHNKSLPFEVVSLPELYSVKMEAETFELEFSHAVDPLTFTSLALATTEPGVTVNTIEPISATKFRITTSGMIDGQNYPFTLAPSVTATDGRALGYLFEFSVTRDLTAPVPPVIQNYSLSSVNYVNNSALVVSVIQEAGTELFVNGTSEGVHAATTLDWQLALNASLNQVVFYSVDAAGHKSPEVTVEFYLDTEVPGLTINQAEAVNTVPTSITVSVANVASGIDVANSSLVLKKRALVVADNFTVENNVVTLNLPSDLVDADYQIECVVADRSGNVSQVLSHALTIDRVAPDAPVVSLSALKTPDANYTFGGTKEAGTSLLVDGVLTTQSSETADWNYTATLVEGDNSFSFTLRDAAGNISEATVVSIVKDQTLAETVYVAALNDAYTANEDGVLTVDVVAGLLTNDVQSLTVQLVTGPDVAEGTLQLNTDGSFTFTPANNFNGVTTFTYQAGNGSYTSNTATVSINVSAVNDAPGAGDDKALVSATTASVIDVLSNDSDIDGDSLTISAWTQPQSGAVDLVDGQFVYTADASFVHTDQFTYTITDGAGGSSSAVVTLYNQEVAIDFETEQGFPGGGWNAYTTITALQDVNDTTWYSADGAYTWTRSDIPPVGVQCLTLTENQSCQFQISEVYDGVSTLAFDYASYSHGTNTAFTVWYDRLDGNGWQQAWTTQVSGMVPAWNVKPWPLISLELNLDGPVIFLFQSTGSKGILIDTVKVTAKP